MLDPKPFQSTELPAATLEEVEWAHERIAGGFTNDFMRRGILNATDEEEAVRFVKHHHSMGGGCGPSGGPGNVRYWYDYQGSKARAHFWFGKAPGPRVGGGHERFIPGGRYVCIRYVETVRKVRSERSAPSLF